MLGDEFPEAESPDLFVPGSVEEALHYLESFLASWRATDGALEWLGRQVGSGQKKQSEPVEAEGPTPASKKALLRLPQHQTVWQVDCRQLSTWVREEGRYVRPWLLLINEDSRGLIVGTDTLLAAPSAKQVWDLLDRSIHQPLAGSSSTPGRPAEIHYPAARPWQELEGHFQDVGIRFQPREDLESARVLFETLSRQMGGEPEPGLLDVPGMTPEQVRSFYEAAASFYRQAPWRLVGFESAIEVRCSKFQSGPWYAVVIGQSGLSLGVVLYDDLQTLRRLWAEPEENERNARETVATSVTFGPPVELPFADVDASQEHGWPVARSDAYPAVYHKERGLTRRPPLVWELELLESCLRALPDFIRRRPQDDTTAEQVTVPTSQGQLTLTLAWVEEAPPDEPPPRRNSRRASTRTRSEGSPRTRGRRRPADAEPEDASDDLLELVQQYWSSIREAYDELKDERPIILFDVQKEEVFAYPYEEFKNEMSPDGQVQLEAQYREAVQNNQVVVFAMDQERQRVVSYSLDLD